MIAVGLDDATVTVRESANGREALRLVGHEGEIGYVKYSPDGSRVITWSAGCDKSGGQDRPTVLKLAHGLPVAHPVHKGMAFLAERVQEKTAGRLRIEIFPSEQLGNENECIQQVQFGALAMTKASSAHLEAFVTELKVLGLPYLFRDDDHMWTVFDGPIGAELLAAGAPNAFKGLCFYDAGARSFYTREKKIETPADVVGRGRRSIYRSPEAIQEVLLAHVPAIRYCYERELKRDPDLKGKVSVRITVGPDGTVKNATIVSSTLNNERVERCILARIRLWKDFKPIDPSEGDVMFRQVYAFGY